MTKKHVITYSIFIVLMLLGVIQSACDKEDESSIGMSIIPGDDKIELKCDTINVSLFTEKNNKIVTDDKTLAPVGSYFDPIFGFSKASFVSQFKLPTNNVNFTNVQEINDISLHLKLYSSYGDSLSPQTVRIYRLNTDIDETQTYYSDYQINVNEHELLTETTLQLNPLDTSRIVKLSLPEELAIDFVNPNNSSHFVNDTIFRKFFKGLYIEPVSVDSDGGIFSFAMMDAGTKVVMTYNDSLNFEFKTDSKVAVLKMFEHNYSSASPELNAVLENPSEQANYAYIQGLGGIKIKMNFPELERFMQMENVSINRAQLRLNVEIDDQEKTYLTPPKLAIIRKSTTSDDMVYITDYITNSKAFNGVYDEATQTYIFNISLNIQEIIDGYINNYDFYIQPHSSRNQATPHRAIINADTRDEKGPKLEIYYSQYKKTT
ncbi:DUF4270 domain-containing protein [Bacteroidales bacterium OttesenSCG-928-I21]|nr:DUF4270 domain-containing protein [Bacteroidales bacterium OttesenSCG-928-I21]